MPLDMLLAGVVIAAGGDKAAAVQVRKTLNSVPDFLVPVARAIELILKGERSSKLVHNLKDPFDRAVIGTLLEHCGAAN